MKNRNIIGLALVAVAATLVCVLASAAGDEASRLFGKAVWYLPYATLVGGIRFLVAA